MENPATWTKAEHIVSHVLTRFDDQQRQGVVGLSLARQITDALRAGGLLVTYDSECFYCGRKLAWIHDEWEDEGGDWECPARPEVMDDDRTYHAQDHRPRILGDPPRGEV
jgi:hypothetical protein